MSKENTDIVTAEETAADVTVGGSAAAVSEDDGREEIFIPRAAGKEEQTLFVSINSVNYLLPKGKTSRVPHHVAEEIRRSMRAQEDLDEIKDKLRKEYQQQ